MPVAALPASAESVPGLRKSPRRDVHGILLLDKPERMTSNQALQAVKRLFNARKAGHTGSLDPLASGLLPICFGEATKLSAYLLDADKEYLVTCRLGVRTTTGDAEGEVVEQRPSLALTQTRIEAALAKFRGEIAQVPPMYSALKHQGRRLYDLAREGVEVAREPRRVVIHALHLQAFDAESITLSVRCSKGTYIRTLVEDIAQALGSCGHVSGLRRTSLGPYGATLPMRALADLQELAADTAALDALLLPPDSAVAQWPEARLGADAAWYFMRGQAVTVPGAPTRGWVRVYSPERFLGLGEVLADGRITPRRLLNIG
ncbi:MAG: tRNA pseudouridine(55) synthase TruB [Gammaproteobacteria bacterium]|nr:tRNA pseudouridine(55) synthase TruB [Gammaproteobacteria bacterium]MBU6508650.1 tRNA pseudouridine(55) synthase TruB [Gammaproteobacteria bacterium]MDE1982995.1 tRNA pseudouridine(55) synthase TruB [Gammaproteobacteria bacterium]MDE2107744.1 tRNA pseudouridine(55) synthase TruB [Gammaproteobacteria bacterium]MDE2461588.1 tRNA pseudouridine(55) synthase TruB [Gammaproteobacteria bacterium]